MNTTSATEASRRTAARPAGSPSASASPSPPSRLVFALEHEHAPSHWFAVFKLIHVGGAVFWVGGGIMLTCSRSMAQTIERPGGASRPSPARRRSSARRCSRRSGLHRPGHGDHDGDQRPHRFRHDLGGHRAGRLRLDLPTGIALVSPRRNGSRTCWRPRAPTQPRHRRRSSGSCSSPASTSACS